MQEITIDVRVKDLNSSIIVVNGRATRRATRYALDNNIKEPIIENCGYIGIKEDGNKLYYQYLYKVYTATK